MTPHVNHPGTQPNPFHVRAWEAQRDTIMQLFRDKLPNVTAAYLNPWRNKDISE